MTARKRFREFGEVIDYDQDAGIVVRGADFQVVVLDQFVEVSTLDVFQLESYIAGIIEYLLTGEALANIAANTTSDAWPCVTFLDPSDHFRNALVFYGIVRTEQDFVLIQLRHDDHARTFVQRALGRGILHTKDTIFIDKQEILFPAKLVTCELTHVLRKDVVVYGPIFLVLAHGHHGFGLRPIP